MIEVLETTKQFYKESSQKQLVVTIPNKNITLTNINIVSESMNLEESIETEDELQFKGCNASRFKLECSEINMDVRGEYIEATIQAGTGEVIPLFKGYVEKQSNRTHEDVVTELECYDVLYKIRDLDVTYWYTHLQSTRTVKQVRDSFFSYLSTQYGYTITQDTVTLVNDSLNLSRMDTDRLPKVLNAGTVLESICQANARYGQIGRDGKFYYRKLKEITEGLYPSYETFPSPTTYPAGENAEVSYPLDTYSKISYEPYKVNKITGVTIRDIEGKATSYGTDTNMFTIADNIIAQTFSNKSTAVQNIYNEVKDVWYIPCNIECRGYPWVECGDALYTNTRRNVVRSFVLRRTLKGIQALFDSIEAEGKQDRDKYEESQTTSISSNRVRVDKIEANYVSVGYLTANYITAGEISATYASITSLEAVDAKFSNLDADNIKAGSLQLKYINGWDVSNNRLVIPNLQVSTSFNCNVGVTINGKTATWQSKNVGGDTIYYLGRASY